MNQTNKNREWVSVAEVLLSKRYQKYNQTEASLLALLSKPKYRKMRVLLERTK